MALSEDERMVYQEGNRLAIAYSQLTLMAGPIFISTAFAIFGLSFTLTSLSHVSLLLMGIASVMLYLIFLVYNMRYGMMVHDIIFPILQDIEKNMKRKIHTEIDKSDKKRKELSPSCYTLARLRFWNYLGFVALIILWIHRIILSGTFFF